MTTRSRTLRALSLLLPTGALGISVALASAPAKAMVVPDPSSDGASGVAARLQAIRAGVTMLDSQTPSPGADPNVTKAWWANGIPWVNVAPWGNGGFRNGGWGNGGFGNGGWGNGGFRNGGWGNGGFANGGWGNGWHNGWRNW
jgi:rSAM-associated Gly-rich repeat protein